MRKLIAIFVLSTALLPCIHAQNQRAQAIQAVLDVSALQALPAPASTSGPTVVFTFQSISGIIGGGQEYVWSSTAMDVADGVYVVQPSSYNAANPPAGRWLATPINKSIGYRVNVKDFGAKGDGSTDDTQAIFRALRSLPSLGLGTEQNPNVSNYCGEVYFPDGAYCVSDTLPMYPYVTFEGQNVNGAILRFKPNLGLTTEKYLIKVYKSNYGGNYTHGVHLKDLTVDAHYETSNPLASGVMFSGAESSSIENMSITGGMHALVMDGCGTCDVRGLAVGGSSREALILENACNHVTFTNINSEHVGSTDLDSDGERYYHILLTAGCFNVHFTTIFIEGYGADDPAHQVNGTFGTNGLKIRDSVNVTVDGISTNVVDTAVRIIGSCDEVSIFGATRTAGSVLIKDDSPGGSTQGFGVTSYFPNRNFTDVGGYGNYTQRTNTSDFYAANITTKTLNAITITGSGSGLTNVPASSVTGVLLASTQTQPVSQVHSTGYTLTNADSGSRQVFSSTTATINAALGVPSTNAFANGWYFLASNTGVYPLVLLAPNGRTIDGQPSVTLPGRTLVMITSDGTNYVTSLAGSGGERLIDFYQLGQNVASVSFTIPAGIHHLRLLCNSNSTGSGSQSSPIIAQLNGDNIPSHYLAQYGYGVGVSSDNSSAGLTVGRANLLNAGYLGDSESIISLMTNPPTTQGGSSMISASAETHGSMYEYLYEPGYPAQYNLGTFSASSRWAGSSSTINTMIILPTNGSFGKGSSFYLYGY